MQSKGFCLDRHKPVYASQNSRIKGIVLSRLIISNNIVYSLRPNEVNAAKKNPNKTYVQCKHAELGPLLIDRMCKVISPAYPNDGSIYVRAACLKPFTAFMIELLQQRSRSALDSGEI